MPAKTLYLLNTGAVTPNFYGSMQDGGTAPTAANAGFGWVPGVTQPTSTPYMRARIGANNPATAAQAGNQISTKTGPVVGTGAGIGAAGDSFISPTTYSGQFEAGTWTVNLGVRTSANAGLHCQLGGRLWFSPNADGSVATEITSGEQDGNTVTMNNNNTTYNSIFSFTTSNFIIMNQYIFLQLQLIIVTGATNSSCNVLFYQSAGTIITPDRDPLSPSYSPLKVYLRR